MHDVLERLWEKTKYIHVKFTNPGCYEKYLRDNKHNCPKFDFKKLFGYFSLEIIWSSQFSSGFALGKPFASWTDIMSNGKHDSTVSRQMFI